MRVDGIAVGADVRFTRVRDLLAIAVVAGVGSWLLVRTNYGSIPPLPTLAGLSLLVLAVVEVVLAFALRARIQRRAGAKALDPLMAARSVALAKASSLVGALTAGLWSGLLAFLLQNQGVLAAASRDTPGAVIGLLSSTVLVSAALWLEYCCRTPKEDHLPPLR